MYFEYEICVQRVCMMSVFVCVCMHVFVRVGFECMYVFCEMNFRLGQVRLYFGVSTVRLPHGQCIMFEENTEACEGRAHNNRLVPDCSTIMIVCMYADHDS